MAGSPALFIDGKFIGCPPATFEKCSFSQRLRSDHPPDDREPGLRFFAIFSAKNKLITVQNRPECPISETGSLLTLPSSAESVANFVFGQKSDRSALH